MKASYQTRQRACMLSFLEKHRGEMLTIEEIVAGLGEDAMGKSTAYRTVARLCEEGKLHRSVREGTRLAVYQLEGAGCCAEHLHLKCVNCGLLIHLDESAQRAITGATGFVIDDERSMLYGLCAHCAEVHGK